MYVPISDSCETSCIWPSFASAPYTILASILLVSTAYSYLSNKLGAHALLWIHTAAYVERTLFGLVICGMHTIYLHQIL